MSVIVLAEGQQQACPLTHGLPGEWSGWRCWGPWAVFPSHCSDADMGYGWQGCVCWEVAACCHLQLELVLAVEDAPWIQTGLFRAMGSTPAEVTEQMEVMLPLHMCLGTINHALVCSTDPVWEGDPPLGEPPGLLQLLHPLPPELPPKGVADAGSPAEPHQPRAPQGGAGGHNGWGVPLHLCHPLSLRHLANL